MEQNTKTKSMSVKKRRIDFAGAELTKPIEVKKSQPSWMLWTWSSDQLVRNFTVVGALLLTILALRSSASPDAVSVFSALQEGAGMEWDESVGKLSFVNSLLPDALQAVWSEEIAIDVYAPAKGDVVHTWSRQEPYVSIQTSTDDVRAAADGEVMSIAHGIGEERIIRVRHQDDSEALYGNLISCFVEAGERVYAGQVIASVMSDRELTFEWREEGRSVDPTAVWKAFEE